MSTQTSTGFEARLHAGESFAQIFDGGALLVYSGAQPASADAPATGTLLALVTNNGLAWSPGSENGLRFSPTQRMVVNHPDQQWVLTGVAVGTPGWCRLVGPDADDGGTSLVAPRIDGAVGPTDSEGDAQLRLLTRLMSMEPSLAADILNWYFARP